MVKGIDPSCLCLIFPPFLVSQVSPDPHASPAVVLVLLGALPAPPAALGLPVALALARLGRGLAPAVPLQPGATHPLQPPPRVRGGQAHHPGVPQPLHAAAATHGRLVLRGFGHHQRHQ